jgi:NleD-like pathogen effector protein (putative zinc metallopeptidase)
MNTVSGAQHRLRGSSDGEQQRRARSRAGSPQVPPHVARALALQCAAGNCATAAMLQRFWVKEGGAYRWEDDETKKSDYVQTNETYWNKWHWAATPVHVPARESIAVSTDLVMDPSMPKKLEIANRIRDDLATIHASAIGKQLLGALATGRHRTRIEPTDFPMSSGPITESPMKPGFDPRDPTKGGPPTVSLAADDDLDVLTLPLEQVREDPPEPVWNPTPRHVALFHELVHAYHHVTGTAASGPLSAAEAVHAGDVGVSHSEYQATGIDTADGVRTYAADEIFSENRYRAELRLNPRNSYVPEGFRTQQAPTGFKDEEKAAV